MARSAYSPILIIAPVPIGSPRFSATIQYTARPAICWDQAPFRYCETDNALPHCHRMVECAPPIKIGEGGAISHARRAQNRLDTSEVWVCCYAIAGSLRPTVVR
jgi:hypothetical protein